MLLRSRQRLLVERSLQALKAHGNTLAIGPCGAGKTVMLSAVAGSLLAEPDAKACILAHRDELTEQNRAKFSRVNPRITTSVFDANEKSWAGQATFAMVQTLARDRHLEAMPALDLLVVDECFVAGTFVDGVPIESIGVGDTVRAFDHARNKVVARPVLRTFKRRPSRLIRIEFEDGSELVCTPNHPFFNPHSQHYEPAVTLACGQEVFSYDNPDDSQLHLVWQGDGSHLAAST
ncbi:MAG: DEAD/DEAH box helicase family protein, partial [Gammaproteobacteria bacterium]